MTLPLGINVNYYQYGDFNTPFLNKFKASYGWRTMPSQFSSTGTTNTGEQAKLHLDSNGYPLQAPGGGGNMYFDTGATATCVGVVIPDANTSFLASGIPATGTGNGCIPIGNWVVRYSGSDGTESLWYWGDAAGTTCTKTGRDIINLTAPSQGIGIQIATLPTGLKAGGNLTNFALIYSPDSVAGADIPANQGANEKAWIADPYAADPTFVTRFGMFDTLRFVDATWNFARSLDGNWSNRPTLGNAFWGITSDGYYGREFILDSYAGGFKFGIGVPWEAQIHLCNVMNRNGWFNFPYNATSNVGTDLDYTYMDGVINLMKPGGTYPLNAPLKAYLEWNDEPWNGNPWPNANSNNGLPAASYYGMQGYAKYGNNSNSIAPYSWYSFVVAKLSKRFHDAWEAALAGSYSRVFPIMGCQFTNAGTQNLALAMPGGGNLNGDGFLSSYYVKCYGIAPYFIGNDPIPLAWTADTDGGAARYFDGWTNDRYMPAGNSHSTVPIATLTDLDGGTLGSRACTAGPTVTLSNSGSAGTFTVTAGLSIRIDTTSTHTFTTTTGETLNGYATAYSGTSLTITKTGFTGASASDTVAIGTGTKNFNVGTGKSGFGAGVGVFCDAGGSNGTMTGTVTSYNSSTGALVVNITSVTGSGTWSSWNIGGTFSAWATTFHYGWIASQTTGGNATVANGDVICINWPNSSGSAPITLKAHDGGTYNVQDYNGANQGMGSGIYSVWFTNATSSGAVAAGWRTFANNNYASGYTGLGYASASGVGQKYYIIDYMNAAEGNSGGFSMVLYEFGLSCGAGQNSAAEAQTAEKKLQYSFTSLEPVYADYLNTLSTYSPLIAHHYNAQRIYSGGSLFWGLVEDYRQTDANCPKYDALLDFMGVTISPSSLPNGVVGVPYSQTLTAVGGTSPYTWSTTSGTLPAGLSLGPSTGIISGTPSATGSSTFTVQASDSSTPTVTGSITYTLTIVSVTYHNLTINVTT